MAINASGLAMMITALGILVLPGIVVNNMQNNGLINPSTAQTCTSAGGGTCVLSASTGCSVSVSYCQLAGSALQFFNGCSPFTYLFTLNYAGLISSLFTFCGNGVSQQTTSAPNVIAGAVGNVTWSSCQRDTAGSLGYVYAWNCASMSPPITGINLPVVIVCAGWNGVFTVDLISCNFVDSTSPTANQFSAFCQLSGTYTSLGPGSPATLTQALCNSFTGFTPAPPGVTANPSLAGGLLGFIVTIIGGALLLLLGFGIGFTAPSAATVGGGGISSNPQGSKMAQTFGIALLIWEPLYNEFSTWFANNYLPYGLDGGGPLSSGVDQGVGLIFLALIALYFVGAYSLSQHGSAAVTG